MEHDFALSIHAYYVGELDAGRRACERLLSQSLEESIEHVVRTNRTWYTRTLDQLLPCRFQRLDVPPAFPGWSLFNPTILTYGNGFLAIVRSSNYVIVDGQYRMPDEDAGTIRTCNQLLLLSPELAVLNCRALADPEYPKTGFAVTGLEDCRLRFTDDGVSVSATVRDVSPFDGRCRIATAKVDVVNAAFTDLRVIDGLVSAENEKNWMPIPWQDRWVYACSREGFVATVDADPNLPGGYRLCQRSRSPALARGFRGGSQLVPLHGGWLCLIHEVAVFNEGGRAYEHRFVWFDEHLRLAKVSEAFAFRELRTIEFAAGLATLGDRLVASFGVRDAEAWLAEMAMEDVWRLLSSPAM